MPLNSTRCVWDSGTVMEVPKPPVGLGFSWRISSFLSTSCIPPELDRGNLISRFDVLIFVDDGIPSGNRGDPFADQGPQHTTTVCGFRWGDVTLARTVPRLREFIEAGGTILTIGGSTVLAQPSRAARDRCAGRGWP